MKLRGLVWKQEGLVYKRDKESQGLSVLLGNVFYDFMPFPFPLCPASFSALLTITGTNTDILQGAGGRDLKPLRSRLTHLNLEPSRNN